ncbi:MAG: ATP-binding protein [Candidatus Thermoplasmatota archaeon]|nr:ATP-binding protein [Candidatus Thermoplasmatota archaeon]
MYVQRDLSDRFRMLSDAINIIALVGPRQCGKTTFLKHISKDMDAGYVTFDDPDVRSIFEDVKSFEGEYVVGNGITILDEVQYGSDPGIKLKYLADRGHRLWITSSSEILLSKDVLSYLVGRVSILRLYPFNLNEMGRARGHGILTEDIERRLVTEHLRFGGYPGIVTQDNNIVKVELLKSLNETLLLKDISRAFAIEDLDAMQRLLRYLAWNSGSAMAIDGISSDLGISFQTVKKYIDALFKSYLIIAVPPYFTNKGLEIVKQSRYFFLDQGLKNGIINDLPLFPEGRAFENYIVSELYKAGFRPKYWRSKGGAEVDIVLEIGRDVIPIEVKLTLERMKVERSMRSFIDKYSPDRAFIVRYKGIKESMVIGSCRVDCLGPSSLIRELKKIGCLDP